jgi:DNA end-binding protein Ku
MKAIWTGAIGFGLVNIPVRLFNAVQDSNLDLDMLDKKDHSRIRFQRINEKTGKEVKWENIVKGYDYEGRYIVLSDEDFQKVSPEKTHTIQIAEFVNQTEIDSIFFETPYYLEPQKAGERAYVLLREALKKSGKVALGSYVLRNKESLCVLKPIENVIVLNKIRFAQEIRNVNELNIPAKTAIKPGELKMALALINQLGSSFNIAKYKDSYADSLLKLIKIKAKGKTIAVPHLRVVHNKAKDLMSQLKASLEDKRKKAS